MYYTRTAHYTAQHPAHMGELGNWWSSTFRPVTRIVARTTPKFISNAADKAEHKLRPYAKLVARAVAAYYTGGASEAALRAYEAMQAQKEAQKQAEKDQADFDRQQAQYNADKAAFDAQSTPQGASAAPASDGNDSASDSSAAPVAVAAEDSASTDDPQTIGSLPVRRTLSRAKPSSQPAGNGGFWTPEHQQMAMIAGASALVFVLLARNNSAASAPASTGSMEKTGQ